MTDLVGTDLFLRIAFMADMETMQFHIAQTGYFLLGILIFAFRGSPKEFVTHKKVLVVQSRSNKLPDAFCFYGK